jgi:hypothetical protein
LHFFFSPHSLLFSIFFSFLYLSSFPSSFFCLSFFFLYLFLSVFRLHSFQSCLSVSCLFNYMRSLFCYIMDFSICQILDIFM